jgi:hypothetical protein
MRAVVPPLTYRGCPGQVATLHQDGAVRAAASPTDHPLYWPRDRILETSNQVFGDLEVCPTFSVRLRFSSDRGQIVSEIQSRLTHCQYSTRKSTS